jgi:hypothetical protein
MYAARAVKNGGPVRIPTFPIQLSRISFVLLVLFLFSLLHFPLLSFLSHFLSSRFSLTLCFPLHFTSTFSLCPSFPFLPPFFPFHLSSLPLFYILPPQQPPSQPNRRESTTKPTRFPCPPRKQHHHGRTTPILIQKIILRHHIPSIAKKRRQRTRIRKIAS